jgi:hypothetical protein
MKVIFSNIHARTSTLELRTIRRSTLAGVIVKVVADELLRVSTWVVEIEIGTATR